MMLRCLSLTFFMLLGMAPTSSHASTEPPVCRELLFNHNSYTVCRFDARTQQLSLYLLKPPTADAFKILKPLHDVAFAMNGGMFHGDGTPVGLLVQNGHQIAPLNLSSDNHNPPGNFFWKPNGVFAVTHDNHVIVTSSDQYDFSVRGRAVTWAMQSGPMLIHEGREHPGFNSSNNENTRNGVGMVDQYNAVFVISNDQVSFPQFASVFLHLGCQEALYLDGHISSLWWPAAKRMDHRQRLATIVAVGPPTTTR